MGRLYPDERHDLHNSGMMPSSSKVLSSEVSTPFWAAISGDADLEDPAEEDDDASASDIVLWVV